MGVRRKTLLLGFAVALLFGTAIYFRLWAIDSSFTVDDREELRRQFDRANMEAMDESASWRMKFDEELDKSRMFQDELLKVKAALANANERLVILRKENSSLQKKLEMLTHSKEQCNCSNSSTLHR
ncbi:hypothetical protein HPP92_027486 [Vanilla planifolia]|uniref:Uncharacterized protein n=1 Tax=Vanilla planifolia TaxID=51239 RepID=A0A835U4B1_VANPL|nr:hypothetical protein HPP92_027486 [Vanilla planifolia]KAG0449116.1 hypothetical protein HPP92_027503 [Vanilla planifolia]